MRTNGPVAAAEEEEEGVADVEKKRGGNNQEWIVLLGLAEHNPQLRLEETE